jgi:hypothetical protein
VDATDPIGILIRTNDLPQTGGPFRVRASLSPEVLRQGQLLLDEGSRQAVRANPLPLAVAVAGLGLAAVLWAGFVYVRARRRERMMRLAPPLWLIPAGSEPQAGEDHAHAPHFDYKLQYVEESGRPTSRKLALDPVRSWSMAEHLGRGADAGRVSQPAFGLPGRGDAWYTHTGVSRPTRSCAS